MSKVGESINNGGDNSTFQNALPLYPDFNDKITGLSSDIISDWISILLSENHERIHNINETFRMFVKPKTVQYLFTICLRMRLPHDVKYIALGIFSEFMVAHINGLYNTIYELPDWTIEQKLKEWEKVEANVSRQLTLRIISCIQIASKIHCYNESLSTKRVKHCLQYLGLAYTEDAICRSELRVLMTLKFSAKSRHTPVTYIESLLSIINKKFDEQSINIIKLWEYSLLFLDCVFLKLDDIYKRILMVIHGNEHAYFQKDHILRIQADYMLLATGVISAACICVYGMEFTEKKIIDQLSELSLIKSNDILDVSTGIMKTVLEHQKSI